MFQMKLQILEKVEIALGQFDLLFGNKRLDDDRTVKDYGLQPESTIYLALRLKGGAGPLTVSTDGLAPEFDCDFTYAKDDGKRYMRVQATVRLEAICGQGCWKVRKRRVAWP